MRARILLFALLVAGIAGAASAQVWQEWVARYNGPGNSWDYATSLAVDGNGNVYVTGPSHGIGTGTFDYATVKYNQAGLQQWVARYNDPENNSDEALNLTLDNNGNVYVTGASFEIETSYDYATIKYDSSGNQLWVARYNGPGNGVDEATAVAVDGNGNVYVTGYSAQNVTSPLNFDYATIKYNSAGAQQWVARYNGPGNGDDEATSLAVDVNGNVYVTGYSSGSGTGPDYATIKYNTAGAQQWVARYNGPGNGEDIASSLAVDSVGNVYVTGTSAGIGTSYDYATIKYDSSGNQLWVVRYNGPGNFDDDAYSLVLDNSGDIYVTGYSLGSGNNYDYATIKYDANGNQLWAARYNGPGNGEDWATSLAVDSNGNVYVTGHSYGSGTGFDYATIKYSQSPSPQLDVTLTPLNPPIVIPANGGSFQFSASVQRTQAPQRAFYVWARDRYPNGTYTGNLLGPVQINPPVGLTVTRQRTQNVPASWPAGLHYYIGYAAPFVGYPATDADSFSWTKSATADGGAWITETSCIGEPFPGEVGGTHSVASMGDMTEHVPPIVTPNPFNATTAISYQLSAISRVSLRVYDLSGRLVATLVEGQQEAGMHSAAFDGSRLASGIYLARLEATEGPFGAGEFSAVQKMVLLK